jgi:heat shock protein HslJ
MQGAERALQQDQKLSQNLSSTQATVTSTDSGTLSTSELAGAVAGGALLIAAAGFGATRKRTPPAQPA